MKIIVTDIRGVEWNIEFDNYRLTDTTLTLDKNQEGNLIATYRFQLANIIGYKVIY